MRFAIAIPTDADSWRLVRRAEELGFSRAWFYDTQMLSADPFVAMAASAQKTTVSTCAPRARCSQPAIRDRTRTATGDCRLTRRVPLSREGEGRGEGGGARGAAGEQSDQAGAKQLTLIWEDFARAEAVRASHSTECPAGFALVSEGSGRAAPLRAPIWPRYWVEARSWRPTAVG